MEQTLFAQVEEAASTGRVGNVCSESPEFLGLKDIGRIDPVDLARFSFSKNRVLSLLSFVELDWWSKFDLNPPIFFRIHLKKRFCLVNPKRFEYKSL